MRELYPRHKTIKLLIALCICAVMSSQLLLAIEGNSDGNVRDKTRSEPHSILAGHWRNDNGLLAISFDWENKVYSGELFGDKFKKPLNLVDELENQVRFRTDGKKIITVRIVDHENIIMFDPDQPNIGIKLTRMKK